MAQALEGLRVLDLTQGPAGGIATMVLADFGADVLCVRRPEPRDAPLDELPAAPMWLRGKQTLEFDLDRGDHQELMRQLVAGADVLMTTWRPNALVRRGLDFQTLHQAYPHLVYCHITGFGSDGPLAELPGYEAVVAAYAGRMQSFSGLVDRTGPVFSAVQVATHACAQSAAQIRWAVHQHLSVGITR
ncbi:MAG: CoA transferase [Pseudomonadales bacterium]